MAISRETRQKNEMTNAVGAMHGFFCADDVHERLRRDDIDVGIATVYRFLKSESKLGRLHVYNCSGKTLYSNEMNSHCHFICTRCKNQQHIKIKDAGFLKDTNVGHACHFQLDVYGVCKRCSSRLEK